jgi:ELWxxDGT repeat protein
VWKRCPRNSVEPTRLRSIPGKSGSQLRVNGAGGFPDFLTNVNGTLLFTADDGGSGQELWKSNGTEAGTVRVKDINPGASDSSPAFLTNVDGKLFFTAYNGSSGQELWNSDGKEKKRKEKKTIPLADIAPGPASSSPGCFTVSGKTFFQSG